MAVHLMLAFLMICYTNKVVNTVHQKLNIHQEFSDLLSQLDASEENIDKVLEDEARVSRYPLLQVRKESDENVPASTAHISETENVTEEYINEQKNVAELLYGGDMILTNKQILTLSHLLYVSRDAIKDANRRWPNAIVPYVFSSKFSSYARNVVQIAISQYNARTCIKFVPRTNQRDYVAFIAGAGCYSYVGRIGGMQVISLANPGCLKPGIAIHEMMHALGYYHEQSRSDRDQYITVLKNNIQQKYWRNFQVEDSNLQGTPYDYGSVMHYGKHAFARQRGLTTIMVKQTGVEIGQRRGLSETDEKSLNLLYCEGEVTTTSQPTRSKTTTTSQPTRSETTTTSQPTRSKTTATSQPTQRRTTATIRTTRTTTTRIEPPRSTDILSMCSLLKQRGFCRFCDLKQKYCIKSCTGQPKSDRKLRCAFWTAGMFCLNKRYAEYMWRNCETSCFQAHTCMP